MAVSAAAVTAKLVALTLSDRNGRTVFFSVIAALVTPVILIVTMILCTLSGTADHTFLLSSSPFMGGICPQRCQQSIGCTSKICRTVLKNWMGC